MKVYFENKYIQNIEGLQYFPVAGTVAGVALMFEKLIQLFQHNKAICNPERFYYIKDTSLLRCVTLLVPVVGNIALILYDEYAQKFQSENFWLNKIAVNPAKLKQAPLNFRLSSNFLLKAIAENVDSFKYAHCSLKQDLSITPKVFHKTYEDFVTHMAKIDISNLAHAPKTLKSKVSFFNNLAKDNLEAFKYVDTEFVAGSFFNTNFSLWEMANEKKDTDKSIQDFWEIFNDNVDIVMQNLPKSLKQRDIFWAIVLNNSTENFHRFCPKEIKNSKNFWLEAIKLTSSPTSILKHIPFHLKNDLSINVNILIKEPASFKNAISSDLLDNNAFFCLVLERSFAYQFKFKDLPEVVKQRKDFWLRFLKSTKYHSKIHEVIDLMPKELLKDKDIWIEIVNKNPSCLTFAPKEIKLNSDIFYQAITKDAKVIDFTADEILCQNTTENEALWAKILYKKGQLLQHAPTGFKSNLILAAIACGNEKSAYKFLNQDLKDDFPTVESILKAHEQSSCQKNKSARK